MTLTMTDLQAALQTVPLSCATQARAEDAEQLHGSVVVSTREVVGKAFSTRLAWFVADQREAARAAYADAPDVERRISAPTVEDMERLAEQEITSTWTWKPPRREIDEDRPRARRQGDPAFTTKTEGQAAQHVIQRLHQRSAVAVSSMSVPVTTQSAPASIARLTAHHEVRHRP